MKITWLEYKIEMVSQKVAHKTELENTKENYRTRPGDSTSNEISF